LARIGTADAMDPLIDALETATGRLAAEFHAALKAVSHETFGPVASTWRTWWRTQKPRGIPKDLPPSENPVDDRYAPPRKKGGPEEPTYYGRRLFSSRIVFVMDVSSSMTTLMTPPEGVVRELGAIQPGPRIEIAKRRLAEAIEKLPDRTKLNLVFFSSDARLWKPSMVPIGSNRKGAIDAVRAAAPDGETNIFAALRAAFGLHGKSLASLDLDEAPDTIYFLTDGEPTRGELTDRPDLLGWVRQVNGYVKAQVHVIAMGNMNIDLDFLDRLALENGGETILLPDR
jgi:Mg-chelatase subunit ChlD